MATTWRSALLGLAFLTLCRAQSGLSTVAGNGTAGFSGDGKPATTAMLSSPIGGLAVDSAGNIYIADIGNDRVRKVTGAGTIGTYAGNGTPGTAGDGGPAISAQLYNLLSTSWSAEGMAVNAAGDLYITDTVNHRVREVTPAGVISTFAGGGLFSVLGDGGPAAKSGVPTPTGVAVDAAGNVYIVDGLRIRVVNTAGIISTVAGNGNPSYSGDGGLATNAAMEPESIAVDSGGNLYIADYVNGVIREVNPAGMITTIAGVKTNGFPSSGDGGPATKAVLQNLHGVAVDKAGNIYISDSPYLRKIDTSGIITTVVSPNGTFGGAVGALTFDPAGNLYLAGYASVYKLAAAPPAAPVISANGVTNGASFLPGISQGSWITVKGANLSGTTRIWGLADFIGNNLPTQLDGVGVTVDGKAAYVYYISPAQLNVLAPADAAVGPVQVQVTYAGQTSNSVSATESTFSPAMFMFDALGQKYVAAVRVDGQYIGPTNLYPGLTAPAHAGDILQLYATGFGPTNPATTIGQTFVGAPPAANTVTATIGGVPATVQFVGLVSPGEYQFNIVAPAGLPSGDNLIVLSVGGVSTQPGAYLTVQ